LGLKEFFRIKKIRKDKVMNILAAAAAPQQTQGQAPYQQMPSQQQLQQQQLMQQQQAYQQQMAMQEGRPAAAQPSLKAKLLGQGLFLFNIVVIVFLLVMVYRFVRAAEKIAKHITGATSPNQNSSTQSQS
jgi:hypothetical protein